MPSSASSKSTTRKLLKHTAFAPGSMMLLGEHAVLHGAPAIVCAITPGIEVQLTPRDDNVINIISDGFGEYQTTLETLAPAAPFQFVLASLTHFKQQLPTGCDLAIRSQHPEAIGLGSSAAVTVATISTITNWLSTEQTESNAPLDRHTLFQTALAVVRSVQKVGSGADVAASVLGGTVFYQLSPHTIRHYDCALPLNLIYSGYKTPTPEVIAHVERRRALLPALYDKLFLTIGDCVKQAEAAIKAKDWPTLGHIMNIHHGLHEALGVSTPTLAAITQQLRQCPGVLGAKISGAGLGDGVVALGQLPETVSHDDLPDGARLVPIQLSARGVEVYRKTQGERE